MSLELTSHPVCGYDGPSGHLFMLLGSAEAKSDDGWSMTVGATPNGTPVVYVRDPAGRFVATYSLPVMALCEEALRLAKEKVRARAAGEVVEEEAPYLDRRLLEDDTP